jgi:hypothetical protein
VVACAIIHRRCLNPAYHGPPILPAKKKKVEPKVIGPVVNQADRVLGPHSSVFPPPISTARFNRSIHPWSSTTQHYLIESSIPFHAIGPLISTALDKLLGCTFSLAAFQTSPLPPSTCKPYPSPASLTASTSRAPLCCTSLTLPKPLRDSRGPSSGPLVLRATQSWPRACVFRACVILTGANLPNRLSLHSSAEESRPSANHPRPGPRYCVLSTLPFSGPLAVHHPWPLDVSCLRPSLLSL